MMKADSKLSKDSIAYTNIYIEGIEMLIWDLGIVENITNITDEAFLRHILLNKIAI